MARRRDGRLSPVPWQGCFCGCWMLDAAGCTATGLRRTRWFRASLWPLLHTAASNARKPMGFPLPPYLIKESKKNQ
ncbi:hypothetical protein CGRA01v4_07549 [Colletotrichum graminicola]|nr:hypothetical protein CGRA01v4_07549 [Colletotrichum graminicola]